MADGEDRTDGRGFSLDDEPEPDGFADWMAVQAVKAAVRRGLSEASAREAFGVPDRGAIG